MRRDVYEWDGGTEEARQRPRRSLFADHPNYSSGLFLLIVFVIEVGVGVFAIRDVRLADSQAQRIYEGAVQGLRGIGELQYDAQETRHSTLYALTTDDANLQVEYADQSRDADRRVNEGIAEYLKQARLLREVELGKRLEYDWASYLRNRDEVLGSILDGSPKEAIHLNLSGGVPTFNRVRQDLDEIKRLYDEQASQQLAIVARSSRRSEIRFVTILMFTLLFGSVSIWVIQRNRIMAALQLAKLQMDFVASISHELRTPIAAISCAGENVRDGLVRSGPDLFEQGGIVTSQANQLMDLVDQVLLFAATTSGVKVRAPRPLLVSEIFDCTMKNTAGLVQVKGFTVEQRIEAGLPSVMGNLATVSQCLQNLIVNAIKYSPKDRWIGMFASLSPNVQGRTEVLLSIHDHGAGISSAELSRIFEPFYRNPDVIAAQIPGTGLGLSVAQGMAHAMGGRLSVTSELGVGSVFTLHLPAAVGRKAQAVKVNSGNLVVR